MHNRSPVFDFIRLYVIGSYGMAGAFTGKMYPVFGQHLVKRCPTYVIGRPFDSGLISLSVTESQPCAGNKEKIQVKTEKIIAVQIKIQLNI